MSIQTNVLENGRWITRNLDPYFVRAQNSREVQKFSRPSKILAKAPSLGLLTRTLIRSSIIKRIIPARIRHRTNNDVLLVSADSVTIKEAYEDGSFENVIVKDDFDAPIRSAGIIGNSGLDDEDGVLKTAEGKARESNAQIPHEVVEDKNPDDHYLRSKKISPQILVLVLESSKLVFLCSLDGEMDQPILLTSHHPLPASRWPHEQLGEHMAVDPKSRAMAIAAYNGNFYIYRLKSMNTINQEIENNSGLRPIKEEILVSLEGSIVKMDFLYPSRGDPDQVILLFLVTHRDKWRMVWYEWSSCCTLRESRLHANRYILPPDERLPQLLIPIVSQTAFVIICEERITVYKDVLTGTPSRHTYPSLPNPHDPESLKHQPLWTSWARSQKPSGYSLTNVEDSVYLCREDGTVQCLELRDDKVHLMDSYHSPGFLDTNVDTAFAVMTMGPQMVNVILAAGGSNDGGFWSRLPHEEPKFIYGFATYAPLRNLTAVVESDDTGGKFGTTKTSQHRLFACLGEGQNGTISELCYGVRAIGKLSAVVLENDMGSSILSVWAFHGSQLNGQGSNNDTTYMVVSHLMQTSLLRLRLGMAPGNCGDQHMERETRLMVEELNLKLSEKALYAACTGRGILVIVSQESITMHTLPVDTVKKEDLDDTDMESDHYHTEGASRFCCFNMPNADTRIVAASMQVHGQMSVLLLAVKEESRFYLRLGYLQTEYEPYGEPWHLQCQPSCVYLRSLGNGLIAFVATLDRKLQIFQVDARGLSTLTPHPYVFQGSFAICDSIAIMRSIKHRKSDSRCLIACGLRDGSVQTLSWYGTKASVPERLAFCENIHIGNTSVTVMNDVRRQSRIFLHCEGLFCTLEYPTEAESEAPATVHRIWITHPNRPTLRQSALSAFTQVVDSWTPGNHAGLTFGSLICVDAHHLHLVDLDNDGQPRIIPKTKKLSGSPEKMIYSSYLGQLIVLSETRTLSRIRPTSKYPKLRGVRKIETFLAFFEIDNNLSTKLSKDIVDTLIEDQPKQAYEVSLSEPTERVIGITEWIPEIGDNKHHLLVISTQLKSATRVIGRLLFFGLPGIDGDAKLKLKKAIRLEDPIYAVAVHPDRQSLVYCSGNELCIQSLITSPNGIKWQTPVKFSMRSPGRHITIKEHCIYVSSARESLKIFKYTDNEISYQYGDQCARDGIHHMHIPERSLVLASDMTGAVVGLWQPPERRSDNAMTTAFEAILPVSINRLQRVARQVWFRDVANPQHDDSIIGTSEDGTITQFDILTKGWGVLRFIQDMAERNPVICPYKDQGHQRRRIVPSLKRAHHMHIDGNIIQRVLERGAEELISVMLAMEPDGPAPARWDKLKELASEVVDTGDRDWLAKLLQWIRYQLRSAL